MHAFGSDGDGIDFDAEGLGERAASFGLRLPELFEPSVRRTMILLFTSLPVL